LLLALGAVLLVADRGAGQGGWKEFAWKEGRCSLQLPATPRPTKHRLQVIHGEGIYTIHYADSADPPRTKIEKAAEEKTREKEREQLLDKARDDLVASLKGKLLKERKLTLDKYPGRELEIEVRALGIYRVRMFQADRRFYQLLLVGPREVTSSRDAERFFTSFRITK
jgi:hypothetical protein